MDQTIINDEAELFAKKIGTDGIFYTSSLTGYGVKELFIATARKLLNTPKPEKRFDTIQIDERQQSAKDCCIVV